MDRTKIAKYVKTIETNLAHIMAELNNPDVESQELVQLAPERSSHIDALMAIDCWPKAVEEDYVADDNPTEQAERAHVILDSLLDESLEGKSLLDFGCGEGYLVDEANNRGAKAIGYDLVKHAHWEKNKSFITDLSVLKSGSFDVIVMYDVLDHCVNVKDPTDIMMTLKKLLKKDGVIYIRCHPWSSKSATHLYKMGINKAYLHLFLKWDEFDYLNVKPMPTRMEKDPITAYHWWFRDFKILSERVCTEPVSQFFFEPSFKQLISDEQQLTGHDLDKFFDSMKIQFVDYKLGNK